MKRVLGNVSYDLTKNSSVKKCIFLSDHLLINHLTWQLQTLQVYRPHDVEGTG